MLLEDWLSLAVAALLAVLHVSGIHRLQPQTWFVQEGLRLFCWMLVCSGLLAALRRARGPGLRPSWFGLAPLVLAPLTLARHFLPFVTLLVGYENVLHLVGRLRPVLYDETLMRLDRLIFPQHPTQWLESLRHPGSHRLVFVLLPVALHLSAAQRGRALSERSPGCLPAVSADVYRGRAGRLSGLSVRAGDRAALLLRALLPRRAHHRTGAAGLRRLAGLAGRAAVGDC